MTQKTIASFSALAAAATLCATSVLAGDASSVSCEGEAHKLSRSGLYCTKCHEPIFTNPVRFACDNKVLTRAYALLFDVADARQTELILKNTKVTKQGIACVEPAFERYLKKNGYGRHSGVVWPHAQGFWARAAFEKGDVKAFEFELNALADKAARDGQFYEIYHPVSGKEYGGLQEIRQKDGSMKIGLWGSCKHQTWSATAYLSLIYYHVLGADIRDGEVTFKPYLPKGVNEIAVKDFKVGNTTFDIVVVRGCEGPKEATSTTTEDKRVKLFLSVDK